MATTRSVTINITANAGAASKSIRMLGVELNALKATLQAVTGVSEKTAGAIRDVGNASAAAKNAAKSAAIAQNETAMATERIGEAAKRSSGMFGNFAKSIGRIALYRAIRSALRAVTQAFKEGLENAYNYSKLFSDGPMSNLAKSMDSVKAASSQLKNQLGAAFGGLISAVAPAIVTVIGYITQLADAITQVFALLGGSGTYMRAKAGMFDDIGKSAGGAGKAVKGLLASFDELNVIGKEASGGGGGSATNFADMFEEAAIDSAIKDLLERTGLKDAIDAFSDAFERFKSSGAADKLLKIAETFGSGIVSEGLTLIADALNIVTDILTGDWESAWKDTKKLCIDIAFGPLQVIADTVDEIAGTKLGPFIKDVRTVFRFMLGVDPYSEKVKEASRRIVLAIATAIDSVTGMLADCYNWINHLLVDIYNAIATHINENGRNIIKFINLVGSGIAIITGRAWTDIDGLPIITEEAFEKIEIKGTNLAERMKEIFSDLGQSIKKSLSVNATASVNVKYSSGLSTLGGIGVADRSLGVVQAYAAGGYPDAGELFMAREEGPELVGRIGNRTAVASNDQIVSGIVGGVEQANSEQNDLLREGITLLGAIARGVRNGIQLTPSVELGQVVQRSEALYARS